MNLSLPLSPFATPPSPYLVLPIPWGETLPFHHPISIPRLLEARRFPVWICLARVSRQPTTLYVPAGLLSEVGSALNPPYSSKVTKEHSIEPTPRV